MEEEGCVLKCAIVICHNRQNYLYIMCLAGMSYGHRMNVFTFGDIILF